MYKSNCLVIGASGLCGEHVLNNVLMKDETNLYAIWNNNTIFNYNHPNSMNYLLGSALCEDNWLYALQKTKPQKILMISNVRFVNPMYNAIKKVNLNTILSSITVVSTTAIHTKFKNYSKTYIDCEQKLICLRKEMNVSIIRPSLVYGHRRDKNLSQLVKFIKLFKCAPIFSKKNPIYQPIYYKDLAQFIAQVYLKGPTNITIDVASQEKINYVNICKSIFQKLNIIPLFIPIPSNYLQQLLMFMENLGMNSKTISYERLQRLSENKLCCNDLFIELYEQKPTTFDAGLSSLITSIATS